MNPAEGRPSFEDWRRDLRARERRCPWPGPRPLEGADQKHLLVGRAADRRKFKQELDHQRLVLLTGPSGVGKTSLLQVGLIPELVTAGYTVVLCRDWSGQLTDQDPASFLAEKIHSALSQQLPNLPRGPGLFWELNKALSDQVVIILDQFEELIRDRSSALDSLYDMLIAVNHQMAIKVVISFRSEYIYKLGPLERRAKPFTLSHYELEEVESRYALAVVNAGNRGQSLAIEPDAARALAAAWRRARDTTAVAGGTDPYRRVGLLHLQGFLYAAHDATNPPVMADSAPLVVPISLGAISTFGTLDRPADLFISGLEQSVDVKLRRCREASQHLHLDDYLIEGTAQAVARAAKHLSSAGYKLVREIVDLATATCGLELDSLQNGTAAVIRSDKKSKRWLRNLSPAAVLRVLVQAVVRSDDADLVDLLSSDRIAIANATDPDGDLAAYLRHAASQIDADPGQVTCGPMTGLAPVAVLIEEFRRFAFGLAWLQETSILRLSTPGDERVMAALIHDGFGDALQRWSEKELNGPSGPLHTLTAPQGASFNWMRAPRNSWPELTGGRTPRLIVNARWRGGSVCARFERVVFVNCDLRGSYFYNCFFRGVTFLNCLLDGAMFSDCEIAGGFEPATGTWTTVAPEFVVPTRDHWLPNSIAAYRGLAFDEPALLSQISGRPAIPAPSDRLAEGAQTWVAEDGGLVVYGGRLSSLVLRRCSFKAGGGLSLRHVAGSGFDVVEQDDDSNFEIYGSVLRHGTFTTSVGRPSHHFGITAVGSQLAHLWFGENLDGTLQADDCVLAQIWSRSPTMTITAGSKSLYYDVPGIIDRDKSCEEVRDLGKLALNAQAMDYRRGPVRVTETST